MGNVFFNINRLFSAFLWVNMLETRKIFCNFAPNIDVDDTSFILKRTDFILKRTEFILEHEYKK